MADYKNAEQYPDPTAYAALKKIEREEQSGFFRPLVYICSPYVGDVVTNTKNARKYSRFAVDKGYIPLASHLLYPQFLDDNNPEERELALLFGRVLLDKCRELWVFGMVRSKGMAVEVERALQKGKTIRSFTKDCEEVEVLYAED